MRFDAVLGQDRAMRRLAGIAKTGRIPAALLFHGPATPFLPQGTYPLRHDVIGDFPLFLVPLGPVPTGPDKGLMRYEAIFT